MAEDSRREDSDDPDSAPSPEGTVLHLLARRLQNLTLQLDGALPALQAGSAGSSTRPADRARASLATTLREAAEGFAVALRHRR